jgi:hypothetical protein
LKAKQALRKEGRVRQVGGGRKALQQQDPEAFKLLQQLLEETTAGDPMSLLKWSSKSTYQIRDQLLAQGHPISEDTVARWLKALDYSLQANAKEHEGSSSPERDRQFRYLNALAQQYMARREPVISVETPKRKNASGPLRTRVGSGGPRASRWKSTCMIFPAWRWARQYPTGPTIRNATRAWSTWAGRMTRPNSPSKAFAVGGTRSAGRRIPRRADS